MVLFTDKSEAIVTDSPTDKVEDNTKLFKSNPGTDSDDDIITDSAVITPTTDSDEFNTTLPLLTILSPDTLKTLTRDICWPSILDIYKY